jgi:hypothetical protein
VHSALSLGGSAAFSSALGSELDDSKPALGGSAAFSSALGSELDDSKPALGGSAAFSSALGSELDDSKPALGGSAAFSSAAIKPSVLGFGSGAFERRSSSSCEMPPLFANLRMTSRIVKGLDADTLAVDTLGADFLDQLDSPYADMLDVEKMSVGGKAGIGCK